MKREKIHLVNQHLEMIHADAFEDCKEIIRQLIRRRHGIYALYKNNHLYYVGLANNLRNRLLCHHLKDKHKGKWDRFSVYLTTDSRNLRELEALAIRIACPKGNSQQGKIGTSVNLKRLFRKEAKQAFWNRLDTITDNKTDDSFDSASLSDIAEGKKPFLGKYIKKGFRIRFLYRGKKYKARVRNNGMIRFRKKLYSSPSKAAFSITKSGINGWRAWQYERTPKYWVPIDELRRGKIRR